ncbi:MAG TPA: ATP synthase subunit I [Steroidobacteraceae bacterium]|nr:ATP synthase subunit I [Steroidobacteraceae bacterium]
MHLFQPPLQPLALPWALALSPLGFGLGCGYFAVLRRGVACLLTGRPGALALLLARMGTVVLLLALAAHWGAPALLSLFGGFLLARAVALRDAGRVRTAPEGS